MRIHGLVGSLIVAVWWASTGATASGAGIRLESEQLTTGPKHHFFGYIGHAGTIPWNRSGRYIVALQTDFQDHMPRPDEAADVILIDTCRGNAIRVVDRSRAWNFQQGTMLYWNPEAEETQFFFNDRDPATGKVFCVLFDISKGENGRRVKEFRFDDAPIGNGGVNPRGGAFAGLNYGRMSRLRPVTGYPGSFDWTSGVKHTDDDGVFRVDVKTGSKTLVASFRRIADALRDTQPNIDDLELFINHTLWNRDGDRIFFYARADFERTPRGLDALFVVSPDGTALTTLKYHLGGHLEWERGHRMFAGSNGRHALFDTDTQEFVRTIGDPATLPDPNGDKALSPDGAWLANGFRKGDTNYYTLFRLADSTSLLSRGFDQRGWTVGVLRIDPSPCWNRTGDRILFPSIAPDAAKSRQLFLIRRVAE
jgi:hypothetical protein